MRVRSPVSNGISIQLCRHSSQEVRPWNMEFAQPVQEPRLAVHLMKWTRSSARPGETRPAAVTPLSSGQAGSHIPIRLQVSRVSTYDNNLNRRLNQSILTASPCPTAPLANSFAYPPCARSPWMPCPTGTP